MTHEDSQILIQFLKALADESRLRILGILTTQEASVEELAAYLGLKPPTVSHHLNRLRELGLVEMRADGNIHFYRFQPETLYRLNRLLRPEKLAQLADVEGDAWEKKVLRDFLNGEELKEIPASRKKRIVILKWLAAKFEPGVRYLESEVNEILGRHHPDYATLRRELVGNGLMRRENGVYWRIINDSDQE
jgi:DNA-binding HxlR family transcriptional regulator